MNTRTLGLAVLMAASVLQGNASGQDTTTAGGHAERWRTETITMFEKPVTVATSEYVSAAVRPEEIPQARVMVACDSVWIRFTSYPNPSLARPVSYFVDDMPSAVMAYHKDTYRTQYDIQFGRVRDLVAKLISGSEFTVAFRWYGGSIVPFSWALRGSGVAILASCRDP